MSEGILLCRMLAGDSAGALSADGPLSVVGYDVLVGHNGVLCSGQTVSWFRQIACLPSLTYTPNRDKQPSQLGFRVGGILARQGAGLGIKIGDVTLPRIMQ